jgi:hypothetical protein
MCRAFLIAGRGAITNRTRITLQAQYDLAVAMRDVGPLVARKVEMAT